MFKGSFMFVSVLLVISIFATYRKTIKISNKKERNEIRSYFMSSMLLSLLVFAYAIANLICF